MPLIVGAAALLRSGGQFLFEIQKAARWRRRPDGLVEIGVGCIGGSLRPGETPRQAVEREVREEIGCGIELTPPPRTFLVDARGAVRPLEPREMPESVFFLWERARGGPGFVPGARVAVYLGRVVGDPAPGDLPAILGMPLPMLRDARGGGLLLQNLLDRGAFIREREAVPRRARVRPVDTARVVAEVMARAPRALRDV